MTREDLLAFEVEDLAVRIWREPSGVLIGAVMFKNNAKLFEPRICDLDPGWWRRMLGLAKQGYGL